MELLEKLLGVGIITIERFESEYYVDFTSDDVLITGHGKTLDAALQIIDHNLQLLVAKESE